jgi:hypothetical protein
MKSTVSESYPNSGVQRAENPISESKVKNSAADMRKENDAFFGNSFVGYNPVRWFSQQSDPYHIQQSILAALLELDRGASLPASFLWRSVAGFHGDSFTQGKSSYRLRLGFL